MLELEDIFIVFGKGTLQEKIVLRGINFSVSDGEIVSLVGNIGSGRSTLLKLLAGHVVPSFGKLWLNKSDITLQILSERAKSFSFISPAHNMGVALNLTVAENLAVASMHHQSKSIFSPALDKETEDMYYEKLRSLNCMGMETTLNQKAADISYLHRSVLALLIATVKGTQFLLIDDYSAGLNKSDAETLRNITAKIIKSQKVTTIMVADDPKFALEVSDKVIVMSAGQVVSILFGEKKKKTKVEDLFAAFKITPKIKEFRPSDI